jgi:Oxidoreductase molybdopterin binding domain
VTLDPDEHNPQDSTAPPEESTTEAIPRDTSGLKTETRADEADNASTLTAQTSGASETVQPAAPDAEDTNEPDDSPVDASGAAKEPMLDSLMEPQSPGEEVDTSIAEHNDVVLSQSRRRTRRSFILAGAAAAGGYSLYNWLDHLPADEHQPDGYRRAFETNAAISRAVFHDEALAPTYPLSKAETLRVNGVYGLKKMLDPATYRLQLVGTSFASSHPRYSRDVTSWEYAYVDEKTLEDQGHDTKTPPPSARTSEKMPPASMVEQERKNEDRSGRMPRGKEEAGESLSTLPVGTPGLLLTMNDILKLPRHELITQFKCIEGWSQIVLWAGVRMVDFIDAYPPAPVDDKEPKYVYMETPDGDYYTGYDFHVCRHPQTLLVTEMMGAPLTQYHGAPLRLLMPLRYGYKQIKRIGLISYTNSKPDDYWTKLGYDWYAGL